MAEYLERPEVDKIKCVILDYDGTLTTFRKGWEFILYPYVRDCIDKDHTAEVNPELEEDIQYFVAHAGGTNPRQLMGRLADLIKKYTGQCESIEYYIKDYGKIFNGEIQRRVAEFSHNSEKYVIHGVRPLLDFLDENNVINYVVTGSCDKAVSDELSILEMSKYFKGVYGANAQTIGNHKEDAIEEIMATHNFGKTEVLIVGDGSTEIRAAKKMSLPSLGIASDEHNGGLCPQKREMLIDVGADVIVADYSNFDEVWNWLHGAV